MSKIEKALGRARRENSLALVPAGKKRSELADDSHDLVKAADVPAAASSRVPTSETIALMHEPEIHGRGDLAQRHIITPGTTENATVQAFREIRTRILQRTKGQNGIILVTSVDGNSGNSFVALNLGVAFAFDASRTALLLDCNLKKSSLQRLFQEENPAGITDYLEHPEMDVASIIHPIGIERLRVIPAGSRRDIPTEYFTTQKVHQLLDGIRQRYAERFVIIDAPPMTESADTQILAELADYVLLVVPYGRATGTQIDSCIKSIDSRKFLGVVFNDDPLLPPLEWKQTPRQTLTSIQNAFNLVGKKILGLAVAIKNVRSKKK
jgi:capsular exopolysaccharide synthesis family protein